MARTTLTPSILTADSSASNLTTISALGTPTTGAGNGVTFANLPGQTLLLVNAGTAGTQSVTVLVGQTVLGQAVTSFSVPVTASAINVVGPFHSVLDQPGAGVTVAVDFTFVAGATTCGVIQLPGVY